LLSLARAAKYEVLGVCDPKLVADGVKVWEGINVIGDDMAIDSYEPGAVNLVLGVGQIPSDLLRESLYRTWKARGYFFPALIHPSAWIAGGVSLASGVQVMAGVIIQPGCQIGENSIINTRASIDHDCIIGGHVHIAPGALLCGSVMVGDGGFIGAGAIVVQSVSIGERALVNAGVVLTRSLDSHTTAKNEVQR
jgi:UDP-perosamine 4-acetyltransferase